MIQKCIQYSSNRIWCSPAIFNAKSLQCFLCGEEMRLKAPVTALLLLSEGLALIGPYLVNSFIYYLSFFRTGGSVYNMLAQKQN